MVEQQAEELCIDTARGAEGGWQERNALVIRIIRLVLRNFFPGRIPKGFVDQTLPLPKSCCTRLPTKLAYDWVPAGVTSSSHSLYRLFVPPVKVAAESTVEAAACEELLAVRRAFAARVSRWSRDAPPTSGPRSEPSARTRLRTLISDLEEDF